MSNIVKKALLVFTLASASLGAGAQSVYPGQHAGKMKVENQAPARAKAFDLRDVRLLPGRVHDNLRRDSAWMASISIDRLTHSFKNNAGIYAGLEGGYESLKKYGGWESLDCDLRGHTTGHLMSAYGLMFAATGESLFKAKGDSIVAVLGKVQDVQGSGYVSAYPEELINRNLRGEGVWAPWYTLHKIMSGLIDQYLYADNEQALAIATRMGEWAYNKLHNQTEETRRKMLRNEFGGMNEAFLNLYSVSGDRRFKEMADYFYHNDVIDPLAEGNTDFGTKHTNTFIPKVIGEARNYELTGSGRSHGIADLFWDEVTSHHSFATGSCSQKEHFFDPDKMSKYINGYTGETCCTYNMLKLSRHLFCLDASPAVADFYERALFNHILAQQDTESGMVCYFLPLLSGAYKVFSTPEQSFWCCVGSGFESHAKYAEAIYYHGDNELFVNLFIPSQLDWKEKGFRLTQRTEFPEQETVRFTIDEASAEPMAISLRYPSWSGKPEVRVNGKKIAVKTKPSSYITVKRRWKAGDVIDVRYPMSLHVETATDDSSRGALLYGPVVLAGNLGSEGIKNGAFSDPTVRNDYYTYNYNIPSGLNTSITIDPRNPAQTITREGKGLRFRSSEGHEILPLYDANHMRYVVYWNLTAERKPEVDNGIFDYILGPEGQRVCLRMPKVQTDVKAVLYTHQNMTEEVLFRSPMFTSKMDSLGVAMVFVQSGSQNWDVKDGCQERFERIMKDMATVSEHSELATAQIIPFGHSAQATFPWNFAAWNPDRTLCIISYHGDAPRTNLCGYGRENIEWGRTRNIDRIPGLMIEGEYEWWEARVRPALAFRMMYPDSRISFLCDAGRGHFDMCEATQYYIVKFIEKALADPRPEGGVYYSRWSEDGKESDNQYNKFWYQDHEMADLTKARYEESRGKKMQYVSAKLNGELIPYNKDNHIKLNALFTGEEFTLEPVFTDESRMAETAEHAAVRPRIVLVSGPAIQTGEYTFRVDPDYFGKDPKRLWSGITVCIEADGDATYKSTVQELNLRKNK